MTGSERDAFDAVEAPGVSGDLDEAHLSAIRERLRDTPTDDGARAKLLVEEAHALLKLGRGQEAWRPARAAFDLAVTQHAWEDAVAASEALFLTEESGALAALGHGIWLSVTFPVNPESTVSLLRQVVEETPDASDGAAVAAAVAQYVAELRGEGAAREGLLFQTGQMLATVAQRHSQVENREQFDYWVERLELDQPDKCLDRLGRIVEVLVGGDWWIDRDTLRAQIPDQ